MKFDGIQKIDRDWLFVGGPQAYLGDLIQRTADEHGVTVADMIGPSRRGEHIQARWHAAWRLRRYTNASFPKIGKLLGGRDHTTAMHAVKQYEARRAN